MPTGLNIHQYYVENSAIKLKPFAYSNKTFNINVMNYKNLNKSKQIRSFMPNLIHSLDAASLVMFCEAFLKDQTLNNHVLKDNIYN